MSNFKERAELRRKAVYAAVKNARPDLYRQAVEIGHMALIDFGGSDENRRAGIVEAAVMSALADAAGISTLPADTEQGKGS